MNCAFEETPTVIPSSPLAERPDSCSSLSKKKESLPGSGGKTVNKLDLSDVKQCDILAEVELRLARLKQQTDFKNPTTYADLDYLKAVTRLGKYQSKERIEGMDKLAECGAVDLFNILYDLYFEQEKINRTLRDILVVLWNGTDSSLKMCQKVLDTCTYEKILKYLKHEKLGPDETNTAKIYVIKGLIGILNNLSRLVDGAADILRESGTIEVLKKYLESTNTMVKCKAEIVLAYIMTEEQYEEMNSEDTNIKFMVGMLADSMASPEHHSKKYGFSADEIVEGLNKIASSDTNKPKIIKYGALPYYVQMMLSSCTAKENYHAARGIWILAFKCAEDIKKVDGCLKAIKVLTDSSDPGIKKQSEGALWILEGKDLETHAPLHIGDRKVEEENEDDSPHIFISYQWGSQSTMLAVRDRLRALGYIVWMDVDAMTGSILEAMALAVEKAAVVLICMSQKYKDSPNCRTEGEYTFRQRKDIIPLRLQPKYLADGWLGAMVGNNLYFDLSVENKFEKSIAGLIKELGDRGKNKVSLQGGQSVDGAQIVSANSVELTAAVPQAKSTAYSWTPAQVDDWLTNTNLGGSTNWFNDVNGSMLMELKELHRDAPEFYYNTLQKEAKLSLKQILKFTSALKNVK